MEKLLSYIQKFRVSEPTKEGLIKLADLDRRKLTEYVRIKLEELVEMKKKEGVIP